MATVTDYFNIDQTHDPKVTSVSELTAGDGAQILFKMFQDFASGAIYLVFRLPQVSNALEHCISLIQEHSLNTALGAAPKFAIRSDNPSGFEVESPTLKFCGRVYIYSDNQLTQEQLTVLNREGKKRGLTVQYIGPEWAAHRSSLEKPLAFISYDSRNRDGIARPLAQELAELRVPVWFDEFSLKVGDSLRDKIETGLKECRHCILILTPEFLSNDGWTKREFDSVFTRELLEKKKVVLPIWAGVSQRDIYEYCPSLADKVALHWSRGLKQVAGDLASKITHF
jgi:hypothetical protein